MDQRSWLGFGAESCFKVFFDSIDKQISDTMVRLHNKNEEHLTAILVGIFKAPEYLVYFAALEDCLGSKRPPGGPVSIAIDVQTHERHLESKTGADLGIILRVVTPVVSVEKAILVQAKRLYPDRNGNLTAASCYSQIKDNSQAKKMLSRTPASFFLLYNPPTVIPLPGRRRVHAGMQMVPASTIEGFDFSRSPSPESLYGHMTSFGNLMTREFFRCNIGDPSRSVIGIAHGRNGEFPVKHTMSFEIGQEGMSPEKMGLKYSDLF